MLRAAALAVLGLLAAGCAAPETPTLQPLKVTSSAFAEGQPIPREFSCDGADRSPPLAVTGFPANASYLVLVFDDPDAPRGTWTHWTFWDLPAGLANLPTGVDVSKLGAVQGKTSAGSTGYHGPCPPGGTHRYIVHAYATAERLGLPAGASVEALQKAVQGRTIAAGTLTGKYTRA